MLIIPRPFRLAATLLALATALPAQRGGGPRDPMQEGLPLKPTRTMSFTTRVGHWMSVDVSPDGQTLAFDLLGDIYTMPIGGGKATALTRGMGFDAQPRFSPDGKKIVYTSDRDGGYNLYTLSLDKKDSVQLTTGKTNRYYSPTFTPDGKYVIATRGTRLYIYDVEGGTGEELVRPDPSAAPAGGRGGAGAGTETLRQLGAAFGGDPRYVWFAQRRGNSLYNTPLSDYSLAVYDRESGQTNVRESRWGSAFRPVLSPDGKWLVYGTRYVNETRLRIRDLRTGDEHWLVYPVQRDDQESAASLDVYPGMAFTPDSKSLIATWDGKLWRVPIPAGKPVEIPFEADVVQPLGPAVRFEYPIPDSSTFVIKQIRDAVPSPDARKLAFVALDRLYVMDYPNGMPRRLTTSTAGEFEPSWSPDGQWITYSTWSGPDGGHVYKAHADGSGQPQKLTTVSAYWQHPTFSPNGQRIVAVRGPARAFNLALAQPTPGGAEDVVWFPASGGDAVFIAAAGGMDQPQFSRDTTRIYGYSGARGLFSMRWDGTDVRSLLRVAEGGGRAGGGGGGGVIGAWISPDGTQALAQASSLDLYTMSIPMLGGAAPQITLGDASNFPNRKLTDIGAQFPAWSSDGKHVHWSIGNAHVVYDLERARAFDDSVRRANRATAPAAGDSAAAGGRGGRGRAAGPQYRPAETRIRVTAERDIPKGVSVLRGAKVVTMKGNEVIDNADIVVTNNRITAIGKRGSVAIPNGAHTIDVAGKTIIPGFVDTHAHLRVASNIHRDVQWSYAVNLAYGVTTARDPQTGATDVLSYEDEARAGNILAPRIYSTGPGVFSYSGVRDLESARRVLRRYSDYYGTQTIKEYETGNREVRQWVIQAANELHLMPTTEGGLDYVMNITEAFDGYSGHEHTIPTYPLQSDVIKLLVESGITYTPTLLVAYGGPWSENYWYEHEDLFNEAKLRRFTPWNDLDAKIFRRGGSNNPAPNGAQAGWFADNQYIMNIAGADIKNLVAAGGRAGIGSHGQLQGLGYHWELWSVAMGGMTTHDALRVATILGADALGLAKDVGSLEVGKQADMLVLDKNPLENIRNSKSIHYVVKNGRVYDGNTLDEVWPRQRKTGTFYWQNDEGGTSVKAAETRTR